MTSETADPRPHGDQGSTPTHPQDTGLSLIGEALSAAFGGLQVFPVYPANDGVCSCPAGHLCDKPGRHPIVPGGIAEAPNDLVTANAWWEKWPSAAIGCS